MDKLNITVGIDVDGVLRDFCDGLEKVVKEHYPQYLPEDAKEIMGQSPAFEENVKQMKEMILWGEEVGVTFVCVTSQKPHARYHTLQWLGNHELNFDTIYFRRGIDKPNTPVDFLVDDSPNNYNYWIKRRGMSEGFILMDRPYNQHIETKNRIFELDEIVDMI